MVQVLSNQGEYRVSSTQARRSGMPLVHSMEDWPQHASKLDSATIFVHHLERYTCVQIPELYNKAEQVALGGC